MGSAMSNEISTQKKISGLNGDQNFAVQKEKNDLVSASLPDISNFTLRDLDTLELNSASVLTLAQAFPDLQARIFVKYLLKQGIQPYADVPFQSAGIIAFLTERWKFNANPEMELLLKLTKLAFLTNTSTRLASLSECGARDGSIKGANGEANETDEEDLLDKFEPVIGDSDNAAESGSTESTSEDAPEENAVKKAWGKGVGYGSSHTGDLAAWDVRDWKKNCISKEDEIVKAFEGITSQMKDDYAYGFISESCVIPTLLTYCMNDSFHDMTSRHTVYTAVFSFLDVLIQDAQYLPLVFETYGTVTLAERICKIGRQAERVVKMGESVEDTTEDDSTRLANLMLAVYRRLLKSVEDCISALRVSQIITQDTTNIQPLLSKMQTLRENLDAEGEEPVVDLVKKLDATNEDYEVVMRDLCFGSVENMFVPHKYNKTDVRVRRKLMKRLAGEYADLPLSLPIHHESSVFFRFCDERMTHAQMLIIPPDGTPYAAGCFIFDVMFPSDYPNSPPKVNLATTGHGSVRFNPNLYNCGKVCLSLLGTWAAESQGEKWNAEISTFLQVAISIQSLIFVPEPYYNEPSYEMDMGTEWGDEQSRAYNDVIEKGTVKYAMIEMLASPPPAWKDVIDSHFTLQGDRALKNVTQWLGAEHSDTKRLATLLTSLQSKRVESSDEAIESRKVGA